MAFDQCSEYGYTHDQAKAAMIRTGNWLERCYKAHEASGKKEQTLFPIIQGNVFKDLRGESLERCKPFVRHGIAIGGLSVGEPKEIMYDALSHGRGLARLPDRRHDTRGGYVRLRSCHPYREKRHGDDFPRQGSGEKRQIQRGFYAARSRVRLLLLQTLYKSLSAPSGEYGRNVRRNASFVA